MNKIYIINEKNEEKNIYETRTIVIFKENETPRVVNCEKVEDLIPVVSRAKEMGFDTLIMGLRDVKAIASYFEIPEDEQILSVIAIGKGDGEPRLNTRKELSEFLKIK